MIDLIEYLNQSGFTDLIRMFLIIGGLLSLAVFLLAIWFFIKMSCDFFKPRKQSFSDYFNIEKKENGHLKRKKKN